MSEADTQRRDLFDRRLGALFGVPDVLATQPATLQVATPLVGDAQTFIVQTYRQRDGGKSGDTVFVQYVDQFGAVRLVLPPAVADCIARQRDALTTKSRKRGAQAAAEDRKARGILPGFMRNGNRPGRRKGKRRAEGE